MEPEKESWRFTPGKAQRKRNVRKRFDGTLGFKNRKTNRVWGKRGKMTHGCPVLGRLGRKKLGTSRKNKFTKYPKQTQSASELKTIQWVKNKGFHELGR